MDIEKLKEMSSYAMYSTDWRDSRDDTTYHLTTLVRLDPLDEKSISATGEDIRTGRKKHFETLDFIKFLEPAKSN